MRSPLLKLFRGFLLAAFFCFAVSQLPGQTTSLDRPRVYDVKNYVIRLNFDRAKKIVYGDTTVELTPLGSQVATVDLDAVDLRFSSVRLDGDSRDLQFTTANGRVSVNLGRAYKPGESIAIRFRYTITGPKKGIYFISASGPDDKFKHPAQIWSQNEPEDARYWFPSFDFPSDKATSEEFITAPKGDIAIGNGRLIDTKPAANGSTVYHFKMEVPHSTYLTSFVIGDFAKLTDKHNEIPLAFYAYKDRQKVAGTAFSKTKEMMSNFETLTGIPFPFAKYDQIMVSGFSEFSGMENVTATTLADNDILFAEYPFGRSIVEDLVSHELAHSWFGDMVTCKNWGELWLNEGFATFMEAVTREKLYGRESYLQKLEEDRDELIVGEAVSKNRHALLNPSAKADNSLFDAITYQKGGLVLHMLRVTVGDANFWKGVNLYLTRHKFDSVTSEELRAAMEQASGQDLKPFFDQWVYSTGYPRLQIQHEYDAQRRQLKLTIEQIQNQDGSTPAAFRFPLDISLSTTSGPVTQTVNVTKRLETFSIDMAEEPSKIEIDRDEKIALKTLKMK